MTETFKTETIHPYVAEEERLYVLHTFTLTGDLTNRIGPLTRLHRVVPLLGLYLVLLFLCVGPAARANCCPE